MLGRPEIVLGKQRPVICCGWGSINSDTRNLSLMMLESYSILYGPQRCSIMMISRD